MFAILPFLTKSSNIKQILFSSGMFFLPAQLTTKTPEPYSSLADLLECLSV